MKIFKRLFDKFKKKHDPNFHKEGLPCYQNNTETSDCKVASGSRCIAAGVNSKITISGICRHPNRQHVDPNQLDGLPITERGWTHCIYYGKNEECYFGGHCEHCKRVWIKGSNNEK